MLRIILAIPFSVINTSNNVVANTIQLTTSPTRVAIGPNGGHLYVGSESGSSIYNRITYITTIYTSNNLVANILTVPPIATSDELLLTAMSMSNSGKHLYLLSYIPSIGSYFDIMNTATDTISSSSPGATNIASGYSLATAPNNDVYFLSNYYYLTFITPIFNYLGMSFGLSCNPGGTDTVLIKNNGYLLCNYDPDSMTVFNTITNVVLKTISLSPYSSNMTASQDGKYVYFNYASGDS